jgi:hypothetical protein
MSPRDEIYWTVPYSTTRMGLGDAQNLAVYHETKYIRIEFDL